MKNKQCTKCKEEKPLGDFGPNTKTADKLASWCKQCNAMGMRLKRNKTQCRPYKPRIGEYIAEYLRKYKKDHGCCCCGEKDPIALDFHHKRDKLFGLGGNRHVGKSIDLIKAEIEKCVVICSNCHRKLHAGRFELTC